MFEGRCFHWWVNDDSLSYELIVKTYQFCSRKLSSRTEYRYNWNIHISVRYVTREIFPSKSLAFRVKVVEKILHRPSSQYVPRSLIAGNFPQPRRRVLFTSGWKFNGHDDSRYLNTRLKNSIEAIIPRPSRFLVRRLKEWEKLVTVIYIRFLRQ